MNIAIIGCGYIGLALATFWKKSTHHLTVTTRSPQKAIPLQPFADSVKILQGNDLEALQKLLQNQDIVVLTLAADHPDTYESTYLETAKTLKKALLHCPGVSQIIYTGSTSVYGDHAGAIVDEETTPLPTNTTNTILIKTEEELLSIASPSCKVCIFRLGEIYGPGRDLAERLRQINEAALPGTGENITNLIHRDDIVNAIDFALNNHLNGVFNLCNDVHIPRKELYEAICTREGLPSVKWNAAKKSIHSGNKTVSNEKIKHFGYRPKMV